MIDNNVVYPVGKSTWAPEKLGSRPIKLDPRFVFHTRRFAETPDSEPELQAFARRPGRVWVLISRPALAKLSEPLPLGEVARDGEREDGYVLLATGFKASGAPVDPAR